MKVKTWHIGCLVVLVLAALYFLVGVREGLDDPKCPAGAPGISSVTLTGGQKVRLYTRAECSAMGGNFAANGKKNWGMATDKVGECLGTSNGINVGFCNQGAAPSAEAQSAVIPITFVEPPAAPPAAPPATPPAAGASMNPTVPSPSPATATAPSYSLTCTAAPVSGMRGSVGMPETPAAWNVSQPPSGWNSRNGYTTTGN